MSRTPRATIEYRNYDLPEYFPVLLLSGEQWHISDIPSGTLHFHNCLEIGICESDSGTMEFMNIQKPFQAGDVTIIASNISHTTYSASGTASKWSYIFVDVMTLLQPMFPMSLLEYSDSVIEMIHNYYDILHAHDNPDIYYLVTSIVRELQQKSINYQFIVRGYILSLMLKLFPIYLRNQNQMPTQTHSHEKVLVIAPAIDYIHEHYMQDFTIEYLADLCGLSPTHFRRLFTQIMEDGPLKYLNHIRIQKASVLLRTTEMPILSISEEVGFHSLSSFNRHFADDLGEAPKDWRKKAVAAQNPAVRKFSGWLIPPRIDSAN